MNPNKKTVNTKNNCPWLLCPSKTLPGKFYYFNGLTGETAWTLTEADKKNLKKNTIQRITDKTHGYPEPLCPPADESTNTSSSSLIKKSNFVNSADFCGRTDFGNRATFGNISNLGNKNFSNSTNSSGQNFCKEPNPSHGGNLGFETNLNRTNLGQATSFNNLCKQFQSLPPPSPIFGQAVFPRYVTNEPVTTKVIWALTPMLIPEQPTNRQTSDQITQYEPQETFKPTPLINRFQNLKVQANPFQTKFHSSTPLKKTEQTFDQDFKMISPKWTQTFDPKPKTKEEACQTFVTKTKGIQTFDTNTVKASKSVENLASTFVENATQSEDNKVKNGIEESGDKLSSLDKNDLRFLLVAKRRKSVDVVDALKSNKDTTNQLKLQSNENPTPKKRVTFDLHDQEGTSEDELSNGSQCSNSIGSEEISRPGELTQKIWYIAVDTAVLLSEYEFIEQFVLSEKNCRLLIPYIVKTEVETKCRGTCTGRQGIFAARKILRRLATPAPHIVVQSKPEEIRADEDSILECCWRSLQDNYHVVLITNNTVLSNKSKTIDLECYTIDEFKDTVNTTESDQEVDLTKVKIVFDNDEKRTENLFQQSISELNLFDFSQSVEIPVHSMRKNLFDKLNAEDDNAFSKDKNTDRLINLTDTHQALKNVSHPHVDEIDKDIRRLDIANDLPANYTFNDPEIINDQDIRLNAKAINQITNNRSDNTIKISGITKLNNVFDLDEELARYYVKSVEMENRVNIRRDEWACRLNQTMEGVFTDILLKEKVRPKKMLPPLNLYEAIQLMAKKFKNQPKLKLIIERFKLHLWNRSSYTGKINKILKPTDFIKLVGFSMIVIQNLKEVLDYVELNEADELLSELIKHIEEPAMDVELSLDKIITPNVNRSDIEFETKMPVAYKKKQADVLEYLKKHFAAMESYEIEKVEPKIVRTVGKDLKMLKINNTKSISIENTENNPTDELNVVVEPKVIRNIQVIDAFEERLKRQTELKLDLDRLDYEETLSTISSENYEEILDYNDKIEHERNPNDDTDEFNHLPESSDIDNECVLAYPLMKAFLNEVKKTLILIYHFINESMQDHQEGDTSEDRKTDIDFKINMAQKFIVKIIDKLRRIIARESSTDGTLKDLLIRAGDYMEEDENMSKYKQVVTKYLEQAQIIEEALNLMVSLSQEKTIPIPKGLEYRGTFATAVASQSETRTSDVMIQLTNQNVV